MPLGKLAHYSIRTKDLEASVKFYTEVMGLFRGYRPDFAFNGAWLYRGGDEAEYGLVHIISDTPEDAAALSGYLGDRASSEVGGGALDHIAFLATNWPAMRQHIQALGVTYREREVPTMGLHQVFLDDPSGVTIELNYPDASST
jgi:catechol 2,3-dioxygenase-like lactoylglutathione lyase family enzyme